MKNRVLSFSKWATLNENSNRSKTYKNEYAFEPLSKEEFNDRLHNAILVLGDWHDAINLPNNDYEKCPNIFLYVDDKANPCFMAYIHYLFDEKEEKYTLNIADSFIEDIDNAEDIINQSQISNMTDLVLPNGSENRITKRFSDFNLAVKYLKNAFNIQNIQYFDSKERAIKYWDERMDLDKVINSTESYLKLNHLEGTFDQISDYLQTINQIHLIDQVCQKLLNNNEK